MTVTSKLAIAATTNPITTTFFRPNLREQKKKSYEPGLISEETISQFSEHQANTIHRADREIGSDDFCTLVIGSHLGNHDGKVE